jgi:histidinol-phosphate aminotransferase
MTDLDKLVRESVKALVPYSSARDEYKGKTGIFMDANENPFGPLNRYPDPYQSELKKEISSYKGIDEKNIFLGNGSDEIIDLCFRTFCNPGVDKALTFSPTYGMYEVSAAINNVQLIKIPLDSSFQIDPGKTKPFLDDPLLKLVFICSPNNPTGNTMSSSDTEYIISHLNGIVVLDEAYIDFSDKPSFKTMINRYQNLIVMQTFSKALGLAAARVGMAFTNPGIVEYFNKMKPPYNISTLNQKAALMRLKKGRLLTNHLRLIKTERERLASNLKKLSIIEEVFPSDANFLMVRTKNADKIYSMLAERKIIVRNRNKAVPGALRITVGKKSENRKLLKALNRISL